MNVDRFPLRRLPAPMSRVLLGVLAAALAGCAAESGRSAGAAPATAGASPTASAAPAESNGKAEKKISMAIGREVGRFTVTNRQEVDAPTGYVGTQYTVKTQAGETYKCEILEPSGLGRIATWGMASGADAMCTNFTDGAKDRGKTNKASCNDLLRAAKKC